MKSLCVDYYDFLGEVQLFFGYASHIIFTQTGITMWMDTSLMDSKWIID